MPKAAYKQNVETNINLLPSEGPSGSVGKTIQWLKTAARYIVIVAEIFLLAVVVLSIKLYTDKINLKDDIRTLSAQVEEQKSFEREFRATTQQISEAKSLNNSRLSTNKIVSDFLALLPTDMSLDSFGLDGGQIKFSGSFTEPAHLQTLVLSFSRSDKFVGLDINDLKSPTETNKKYTFSASIIVLEEKFK
jgi:Tfp pilus assembly protein PilN